MKQKIVGFDKDEDGDWSAELECGHYQHVRHRTRMIIREWVWWEEGGQEKLGVKLECKKGGPQHPADARL